MARRFPGMGSSRVVLVPGLLEKGVYPGFGMGVFELPDPERSRIGHFRDGVAA